MKLTFITSINYFFDGQLNCVINCNPISRAFTEKLGTKYIRSHFNEGKK